MERPPVPRHGIAENVTREHLANGLTVLIKENHSAPVVALFASVQVGYFHEPDRWNGIAHVIEHMLFKGTPRRPEKEQIAGEVRDLGGLINAGTYYEDTSYYLVVPSQHLERALDIQADLIQNSVIDPEELAKEIEVIVQESQQKRDNPSAMLVESLYTLAYDTHRIRRWRIGHPETLRSFRQADLRAFMEATYRPENMILTIVGDVETNQALALVRTFWESMPRGEMRLEHSPAEPPREGFRYRRMTGDTRQRLLLFAVPAPPILHPDAPALMVLSALLSDGRSARLYRRLKEELRLANSAWASYEGFDHLGIFTLGAESIGDAPLPVEQALWTEATRLRNDLVDAGDLERIKTRIESRRLYAQEEVMGVARTLTTYEALGDYHLSDTMLENLRAVSAEDVQRVARVYLNLAHASLMEYLPAGLARPEHTSQEVEAALRAQETDGAIRSAPLPLETAVQPSPAVFTPIIREATPAAREIALPGGGKLLFKARHDLPLVSLTALFRGGRRNETRETCGLTNLMLKSTLKGTRARTAEEIANQIEGLGSGIGMSVSPDYLGYGVKIKRDALEKGFALFADVLENPTFPADEVEREKQAIYAEIRRQHDSSFSLAYDLFTAAYYGDRHPYGLPSSGIEEAVAAQTPETLAAWHARLLTRENLVVGLVGDLTEEEAIALLADLLRAEGRGDGMGSASAIGERVGDWRRDEGKAEGENPSLQPSREAGSPQPSSEQVLYRQKQQTAAALGFPGADLFHPDRYALDVLAEITSGMSGRFFRSVRGDNALAYQVTGFHRSRLDSGNFVTYTATAPENERRARDLILRECVLLGREPVTAEELAAAKASIVGEHVIGTQTFGAQAGELAATGVYGLPIDEPQRYLARIEAITAEEAQDVAARYLQPDRFWLGVVRGGTSAADTSV